MRWTVSAVLDRLPLSAAFIGRVDGLSILFKMGDPPNQTPSVTKRGLFVGLATVDVSYVVESIPPPNSKVSVSTQQIVAGGPATNAAVTFAFFGGTATLLTAIGQHPVSAVIRRDVESFPVQVYDIAADRQEPPPVSSIFIIRGTGERTVVSPTANAFPLLSFNLDETWFDGVSIMLVDGQYMPMCVAAAEFAHSRGIPVVLDAGSWKEGMPDLLPYIDIAICSDDFRPPGCRHVKDALEYIVGRGIRRVAITRGAAAIMYVDRDENGEVPVEPICAVDTLGAGDIFHGAFCYRFSQPGHTFRESLAFATRVATFSCRHQGTRAWMQAFDPAQRTQSPWADGSLPRD